MTVIGALSRPSKRGAFTCAIMSVSASVALGIMVAARPVANKWRLDIGLTMMVGAVCFHSVSIVEQENWGNAVYALHAIILLRAPRFCAWTVPSELPIRAMVFRS